MLIRFYFSSKFTNGLWLVLALSIPVVWFAYPQVVGGEHADAEHLAVHSLSVPSSIAAAEPDAETAFREEDAGISAFVRVRVQQGVGSQSRVDINTIVGALTSAPTESAVRDAGDVVDWGVNFGIIKLPMYAAVISRAPVENVTVYFDDEGWVVAYLPRDRPAAALWKYGSADGTTVNNPQADQNLERNLLVVAINEVLKARDPASSEVNPSDVDYYDWTCTRCDAFVLFSGVASSGNPDEIKFVVPYTISLIQSSAAVVLTEQIDSGGDDTASIAVDGKTIVTADADSPLNSAKFDLDRESESTSLHRVVINGPSDNIAVGAVMLLYDRP